MNNKRIGIVGGGQLGKMLTDAAHKLGFHVTVLDPAPHAPASAVADRHIVGDFKDKDAVKNLAKEVDIMTFEIESANAEALEELEKEGKHIFPQSRVLKIIKDKFRQKEFLREHDIDVADFALIENESDAEKQSEIFGYPFLLKARYDAYDGRGNALIKSKGDISEAFSKLSKSPLYCERFVPFVKELAVISARDQKGNIATYPVVETVHKNNICHIVKAPADVSEEIKEAAKKVADRTMQALDGVGVFAIELFLTEGGEIVVNEIAPRVHNSGHYSIEGSATSQFENHIRAITGLPLGPTDMARPNAVMVNILGEREGPASPEGLESFQNDDSIFIHIYGKLETRKERKMGHITVVGESPEETLERALSVRKSISI